MQLTPENLLWINRFRERHGRAPRILHIGNIANNAYNNARLLNEAGLVCDVICYDYYHIMGCPEWEDADISGDYGDQFRPSWVNASAINFQRPRWFVQGPLVECIKYLQAKQSGNILEAEALWLELGLINQTQIASKEAGTDRWRFGKRYAEKLARAVKYIAKSKGVASRIAGACDSGRVSTVVHSEFLRLTAALFLISIAVVIRGSAGFLNLLSAKIKNKTNSEGSATEFDLRSEWLVHKFTEVFPSRSDRLTTNDLQSYRSVMPLWKELFAHYDLVQAYATDPILPMLAANKPYVGFEHGTLRSHTLGDEPICRLTSLAYHLADHVFITNGDCIDYARRIGVTRFSPMLHPVDERRIAQIAADDGGLRAEHGVRYLFVCTLRHDWSIKGTDQYIRALPELVKSIGRNFRVVMTRWGGDLQRSYQLAQAQGVNDLIVWVDPLPRRRLIQVLKAADVLLDQLTLPHFGATAPEGIAAGIPVIMSYDSTSTDWIVAEPAPILVARNATDVVAQISRALDPLFIHDYRSRAKTWFEKYHSSSLVLNHHVMNYRSVLSKH